MALALAGVAAAASAADVGVYGLIDSGLSWKRIDADDGRGAVETAEAASGVSKGNRWGLKGSEDLGGVRVGFVLENGFEIDSGEFAKATGTRLFGREAQLYVEADGWGRLAMGRLQHLTAGYGSWGVAAGVLSPYAIGWSSHIAGYKNVFGFNSGRIDNAVAWASPALGGFTVHAIYSGNTDQMSGPGAGEENRSANDRYAGLGLRYVSGPLASIVTVERTQWSAVRAETKDMDDGIAVTAGANCDFGPARLYLAGQWFRNQWRLASPSEIVPLRHRGATGADDRSVNGWGATLGAKIPAAGGHVLAAFGLRRAELSNRPDMEANRLSGTLGYTHPLSKRTNVYAAASVTRDEVDRQKAAGSDDCESVRPSAAQAVIGLVHTF